MAKRELNNNKYKGLTGLICKKIEKLLKLIWVHFVV